jgi:hypothetical protein
MDSGGGIGSGYATPSPRLRGEVMNADALRNADSIFRQQGNSVQSRHCEPTGRANARPMTASEEIQTPSFRGDAKHRTRNLEIPGLVLRTIPE